MSTCCSFVHPALSHPTGTPPEASVLAGPAIPLADHAPPTRGDMITGALLAWFAGLLVTAAAVAVVTVNVPLVELAALHLSRS